MSFSLEDFHKTRNHIRNFTNDYLDILKSFYDERTCSFCRLSVDDLNGQRDDLWEKISKKQKSDEVKLWRKYFKGKKITKDIIFNYKINLTSSTSCFLSLDKYYKEKKRDLLKELNCDKNKLKNIILKVPWTSAKLDDNNVYTICLLLPALKRLGANKETDERVKESLSKIEEQLMLNKEEIEQLINNNKEEILKITNRERKFGAIALYNYPPNGFLTYWALKSLEAFAVFKKDDYKCTELWAYNEINKQIFYHNSKKIEKFDVFQLVYSLLVLKKYFKDFYKEHFFKSEVEYCLDIIFENQTDEGSWKSDKPLFHYPGAGNAYCHDYEMLISLLEEYSGDDFEILERYYEHFQKTINWIDDHYQSDRDPRGWCSYHNHQWIYPESWATASVLQFLLLYEKLLLKIMQKNILLSFNYDKNLLKTELSFDQLWDIDFIYNGKNNSLKKVIVDIIDKLKEEDIKSESIGIILFGPPGSSKTSISKAIAKYIGWKFVEIDPGRFIENGIDKIEHTAKNIFNKLNILDNVIILFDEFDELVRVRERQTETSPSELINRFITTSMLPKIQKLKQEKNKIFIIATNHLNNFDPAIRRRGRFDFIIRVDYPAYREKKKSLIKLFDEKGVSVEDKDKFFETGFIEKKYDIKTKKKETGEEELAISLKELIKKTSFLDFKSIKKDIVELFPIEDAQIDNAVKDLLQNNIEYIESYNEWEKPHKENNIKSRID